MKFLNNDYDFGLNYHPGKANVVADALSQKMLHASWMMVKEAELVESFGDLKVQNWSSKKTSPLLKKES